MIPPCRCKTCGSPVGDVAPIYYAERLRRVKAALASRRILASHSLTDMAMHVDMADILDLLGIHADCCVITVTTHMDIEDYY
jgi:DNA-directed RNA polymerase subunit N (RpoN/RPB10)